MKRFVKVLKAAFPPLASLVIVLGLWQWLVGFFSVPAYLLPPPSDIARTLFSQAGELAFAAWITARSALIGFFLSATVGVAIAVVLSYSRILERSFYPYAVFLQTVPIVAIAPLLVLWFGPGERAVSASAFIVSIFPVIVNTLAGLRSVEPALRDLFRLYGASKLQSLWLLSLPSALPNIVTGLRVAGGLSVIGALVGEFVAGFAEGAPGLGIKVQAANKQFQTDLVFAAVLCASLLGLALFGATNLLGYLLLRRWHPSEKA